MTDMSERDGTEDISGTTVLTVECSFTGSRCSLTMKGQLVVSSIAALEVQIEQIGCSQCEDVELDVSGLTTLDAAGARVLTGLATYVRALGAALWVVGAAGRVAEALDPDRPLPARAVDIGTRASGREAVRDTVVPGDVSLALVPVALPEWSAAEDWG